MDRPSQLVWIGIGLGRGQWQVAKVGHVENGEPLVQLRIWTVTGETVVFMPGTAARRMATQLTEQALGIHLAMEEL